MNERTKERRNDSTPNINPFLPFQISLAKETTFIVFPYGSKRSKLTKQKHVANLKEALKTASEFIPDITTRLDSNVDGTNSQLRAFFQKIFMTRPIKFPVIYFTGISLKG